MGAEIFHAEGRTEMKLIVDFLNFADPSKNELGIQYRTPSKKIKVSQNATLCDLLERRQIFVGMFGLFLQSKPECQLTFWRRNYFFNFSTLCI